nr:GTP-binding protein [Lachnospiraceae bacterium]
EWDETYGDRMNQIVFIGKAYDQKAVEEKLKQCMAVGNE